MTVRRDSRWSSPALFFCSRFCRCFWRCTSPCRGGRRRMWFCCCSRFCSTPGASQCTCGSWWPPSAFNWLFAFIIGKCGEGKTAPKRFWLVAALAANLLVLGFYKYQGFLAENINRAIGEEFIAELNLALPIGISFFTLQAITYVVDVYRGEVKVQKNPLYLGMYIAMFPQLVAGHDRALRRHRARDRPSPRDAGGLCPGPAAVLRGPGQEGAARQHRRRAGRLASAPRGGRDRLHRLLLGRGRLHLPDLLRLLRLLGHGHRPRQDDGLRVPAQLQLPLHVEVGHGVSGAAGTCRSAASSATTCTSRSAATA